MGTASGWTRREISSRGAAPAAIAAAAGADAAEAGEFAMSIVPGCQLEGRLEVVGSIRVEGEFRGELVSDATVFIAEEAAVEASIRARSVVIRGAVVGDVHATREVVLQPTGRLKGAVETPSFVIERGAVFNGETRMFRPERSAREGV